MKPAAELLQLLSLVLLCISCGAENIDADGLVSPESAVEQFARASQYYYRGRLTAAFEEFNGVIYRYPDSPLASDARLAVRRIESDLSGEPIQTGNDDHTNLSVQIAVVGKLAVNASVVSVASALRTLGTPVTELTDNQAPELTVVFYSPGCDYAASVVADSLGKWLSSPQTIAFRPGEELIDAVAGGYDVLVIVGEDAVISSLMP